MQHKDVKKWLKVLPSCLDERKQHLDQGWETEGWCGACGRANEDYTVTIKAGDQLKVWTDKNDIILALAHNNRLIVFPKVV